MRQGQFAKIGPERIGRYVLDKNRAPPCRRSPARPLAFTDFHVFDGGVVFIGKARCTAQFEMFSIFGKQQDRRQHAIAGLFFSQTDDVGQYGFAIAPQCDAAENLLLAAPYFCQIPVRQWIGRGGSIGGLRIFDGPLHSKVDKVASPGNLTRY